MKKRWMLIGGAAAIALACSVQAQVTNVIIGGDAGNGNFTTVDPYAASHAVTTNTTGRRLIQTSIIGSYIAVPGWRLERTYISGGNASYGWDGAAGTPIGGPDYVFGNSGDWTLSSDTIYAAGMVSGSVATVSFELAMTTILSSNAASCAGTVDFGGGQTFSWTAADATAVAANTLLSFNTNFVLTADSSQASITLYPSTGRNTDGSTGGGQVKIDNVSLVVVSPETAYESIILLGGDLGNGNIQTVDPFHAWTNSARTNEMTYVTNSTLRRMFQNSDIGRVVDFPGWSARRTYYMGGNNAWAIDDTAGSGKAGYPNAYYFMNSGDATLTSSNYPVLLFPGDTLTVSFNMWMANLITNEVAVPPSCAGKIDFGGGHVYEWTAEETYVLANQTMVGFTKDFAMTNSASEMTVELYFSTGRGDQTNALRSANQCLIDDITVVAKRPPSPPSIVGFKLVAPGIYEIEVETKNPDVQHLLGSTDLVNGGWSSIPHSDDGLNPYVQTNLLYSTPNGVNRVIYIQSGDAQAFFGVSAD